MRTLDRLVAVTFLRLFLISVVATPPLFILGNLTEKLNLFLDQGLTPMELARGYFFNLPEYLHWSFPIAGLIAAVFTVHRMTVHREILAAKAGGVSFHRLVAPILVCGLLLAAGAFAAVDLVPLSKRRALEILEQRAPTREWRSNFVFQTEDGHYLMVQRLDLTGPRMTGVGIHHPPTGADSVSTHAVAEMGVHDATGWTFERGTLRRIWMGGDQATMRFASLRVPAVIEPPDQLMEEVRDEDEMTYAELDRQARIVERSGGNAARLRVKQEQKLAIPVATFVILLFGVPLATSAKRGGAAYGIGISLGSTLLYMLFFKITAGFGASGTIPPLWAAWTPNGVFFAAGVVLLARVRT